MGSGAGQAPPVNGPGGSGGAGEGTGRGCSGEGGQERGCPRLLLGDRVGVRALRVLRCLMLLFQRFSRCLFPSAWLSMGSPMPRHFFFSPPRLHQAHKMCENVTFSLSACFSLRFFFPLLPVLPCQGRSSFSCLLLLVFLMPWECRALSQSTQTVQTPLRLLRRDAPENPVDVPKCAQGRGFWLPSPWLSSACGGTLERGGFSPSMREKQNFGRLRVMLMLLDGPVPLALYLQLRGGAWQCLVFSPPSRLAVAFVSFLPFSSRSKTPVSCFPSGCLDLPRPRNRDAGESPPGPQCTFFPLLSKLRQTSPIPASLGAFPE